MTSLRALNTRAALIIAPGAGCYLPADRVKCGSALPITDNASLLVGIQTVMDVLAT